MPDDTANNALGEFISEWQKSGQETAYFYQGMCDELKTLDGVTFEFSGRPGISYSVRPTHPDLQGKDFFAVFDVIDDDPTDRWLSICFYSDLITDPEERGEIIPGGLAGGHGYCFDVFANDEEALSYLKERLNEAYHNIVSV